MLNKENNKKNYRVITSGGNERREYLSLNRSSLFLDLPKIDTAQEQKKSYFDFLNNKLKQLLNFYFPVTFSDHNNTINLNVTDFILQEPEMSEKEVRVKSFTWAYRLLLNWKADWVCYGININLEKKEKKESSLKEVIEKWVKKSFKIGSFELLELSPGKWQVKEKKVFSEILIEEKERTDDFLSVSFRKREEREILLCHLPKITNQGVFIINGHYKVVVCQSIRAPSVYCFPGGEQQKDYSEIIPAKGSWISISFNLLSKKIELKFLNSKKIVTLREILNSFDIPSEYLEILLLGSGDKEESKAKKSVKTESNKVENKSEYIGSKFLFSKKNSYFEFGKLGRQKFNERTLLKTRLINQTLAEDIRNSGGKVILEKDSILTVNALNVLQKLLEEEDVNSFSFPEDSHDKVYWVKIKSPTVPDEVISVVGIIKESPLTRTYFDIADLFCVISLHINDQHGVGYADLERDKDKLGNQIIRRIGDLLYNTFDSKLGGFLYQDMARKYLANISQLKKADLAKMPNLKDFDNLLRIFFNISPLVQLQNQNNPLAEIAYTRKVSTLGLGGFNANNITLTARNVDESHYGRYGLMSTQEGKNFGLNHNLSLGAIINADGQIVSPYYLVKNGVVQKDLVYLTSDDEHDKYITHCNIKINEENKIMDESVLVRNKGRIFWVSRDLIDYIDSSFYNICSVEESMGPFTPYNDATRTLMTSNMHRGAIPLLNNQNPLISTGTEVTLRENSFLAVRAEEEGVVEFADNNRIIIRNDTSDNQKIYELNQALITNKDILNFSFPLVKRGERVKKDQFIADGHYSKNGELSLGYNLRVAYMSCHCNFEDAIIFSDKLIKEDIFTYAAAKEYVIIRYNTAYGPEIFSNMDTFSGKEVKPYLDKDGIIKVGSIVAGNSILVRKLTPQMDTKETEEEMLLFKILGGKGQRYVDSSLYLPKGESNRGIVYEVEREEKSGLEDDELEIIKIHIAYERKIEDGDKVTARHGNKGIVKIIPTVDMPYTEEGPFDMILNPLGVPSRMNMGQLLETLLSEAAFRLNTKLLIRPFNTISIQDVHHISQEAGIPDLGNRTVWDGRTGMPYDQKVFCGRIYTMLLNHKSVDKIHARSVGSYSLIFQQPLKGRKRDGGQRVGEMEGWCLEAHGAAKTLLRLYSSDDIRKRHELQSYLLFDKRRFNLSYNKSESFNLVLQYLRGVGFDLKAKDFQGKNIDFYKYFSE